jgi:hypothetical protein
MSTIPVVENNTPTQLGGSKKKKNCHKAMCECPICVNMKHANKSKYTKNKKNKRCNSKRKCGGEGVEGVEGEEIKAQDGDYEKFEELLVNGGRRRRCKTRKSRKHKSRHHRKRTRRHNRG